MTFLLRLYISFCSTCQPYHQSVYILVYVACIWVRFMRLQNNYRPLNIEYTYQSRNSNISILHLEKSLSVLEFEINHQFRHIPHIAFLQRTGNVIRSLKIGKFCDISSEIFKMSKIYEPFKGDSWIYQTLQLCPQLRELTLCQPVNMEHTTDNTFRHIELKSFTIEKITYNTQLNFLSRFSSNLPNPQELHLRYIDKPYILKYEVIEINMPFTMFHLLTWTSLANPTFAGETLEYFIKLNTMTNLQHFFYSNETLYPISMSQFEKAPTLLCFNITCLALIEFRVVFEDFFDNNIVSLHNWCLV